MKETGSLEYKTWKRKNSWHYIFLRSRHHTFLRHHETSIFHTERLVLVYSEKLFPWFHWWWWARKGMKGKVWGSPVLLSFGRMEGTVLPPTQSPTSGAEEEEEGSLGGSPPSPTKGLLRGLELSLRDVSWLHNISTVLCWLLLQHKFPFVNMES